MTESAQQQLNTHESDLQSFLNQTLAVLVLYKCDPSASPTIKTLAPSLEADGCSLHLFIHDNSPQIHSINSIPDPFRVEYHHDPSNPGVAKAYNSGARAARKSGRRWLLLIDQDTSFPPDALTRYADAVRDRPGSFLFAPRLISQGSLCSPCGYLGGMGYHLSRIEPGLMKLKGRSLLNSGILISIEAFDAIGGFDERIPLDFADHDFCRRFGERYRNALVLGMDCEHGFSDREHGSIESALARFAFFCRGARYSMRPLSDYISHPLVVAIRCTVLSLRYRSIRFIPVMLKELFFATDASTERSRS